MQFTKEFLWYELETAEMWIKRATQELAEANAKRERIIAQLDAHAETHQ